MARAVVLMMLLLPDYLWDEIRFSDAGEIDEQGSALYEQYNYSVTAWTKIQGLRIRWRLVFYERES